MSEVYFFIICLKKLDYLWETAALVSRNEALGANNYISQNATQLEFTWEHFCIKDWVVGFLKS